MASHNRTKMCENDVTIVQAKNQRRTLKLNPAYCIDVHESDAKTRLSDRPTFAILKLKEGLWNRDSEKEKYERPTEILEFRIDFYLPMSS